MPEPIPSIIDYRVTEIHHAPTLKAWNVNKMFDSASFLCRVTMINGHTIDSVPIAVFNSDREANMFALDFLKQGK